MNKFFTINTHHLVKTTFARRPYIMIDILVVDPTAQKRGIGAKLLQHIITGADSLNVPTALESTPAGLPLYWSHQFEVKDIVKADMKAFGWEKEYDEEACKRVWMVREPQAKKTSGEAN